MNRIKKTAKSTARFVDEHRVAIAVTATSIWWMYVLRTQAGQYNEFLKEHGLYEKYMFTEEELEES